jgi:hypothetical protein
VRQRAQRLGRRGVVFAAAAALAATVPAAWALVWQGGAPRGPEKRVHFTAETPDASEIPRRGLAHNFRLVAHLPLLDDFQYAGRRAEDIPRGSNGDLTATGDCLYVGSFVGYLPPLVVDAANPTRPRVVGPVPDAVPGVGNGIEGIEASGDLLVIDQRRALGGLGFDVPAGLPERALSVWDVSDCRRPRLVARYDYQGKTTHTVMLWRDPQDTRRVLAVQSFSDQPTIQVIDLSGCPRDCRPRLAATWDLHMQTGIEEHTHEATMSTDGRRIYMSQYRAGFFMLDSTRLLEAVRGGPACNPDPPPTAEAEGHCLTLLNRDIEAREDTAPPFVGEWHHTSLKVPDRPYLVELAESGGPRWVPETGEILSNCPGSFIRFLYVGEDEYTDQATTTGPRLMRGDLDPETVGAYGTPEQRLENCTREGYRPGTAPPIAWFSPHDAVVFPRLVITTYYGAGLRAIDIANPYLPVETGHFLNKPVRDVRWCSYGACRDPVIGPDQLAERRPVAGDPQPFAFSFPLTKDGYVFYADVHSGLYVLRYRGPHAREIPRRGVCVADNARAGFEPCRPYGRTNWGTPGQ